MKKMASSLKRWMTLALVMVLLIGLVPAGAWAEVITDVTTPETTVDQSQDTTLDSDQDQADQTDTDTEDVVDDGEDANVSDAQDTAEDNGEASAAVLSDDGEDTLYSSEAAPAAATWDSSYDDYTVQGMTPTGTTVNLFDYSVDGQDYWRNKGNNTNAGINSIDTRTVHRLRFGQGGPEGYDVNGWYQKGDIVKGIVKNQLVNGYPQLDKNVSAGNRVGNASVIDEDESLAYLFDPTVDHEGKTSYANVDGLFQIDQNGYYYYNSQSREYDRTQNPNPATSYDSANYAVYDEATNSFKLMNSWGVGTTGGSDGVAERAQGQFFPFDSPSSVFTINSGSLNTNGVTSTSALRNSNQASTANNPGLNHYFGLTMSTRFIQQNGGYTKPEGEDGRKPVTYEFSGDDDVWIYIDGVLVADLGGMRNKASVEINFSTGVITITDNGVSRTTSLAEAFEKAGVTDNLYTNSAGNKIFADNTYHTLNFYYLERGHGNSNLSLKYNLQTVPESDIVKVDQVGDKIAGAGFELYAAEVDNNGNYTVKDENKPIAVMTTNTNGEAVLEDAEDGSILSLDDLANKGALNFILRETKKPTGYRSAGDVWLRLQEMNDHYVLLCSNRFTTGANAVGKVRTTAPNKPQYYLRANDPTSATDVPMPNNQLDGTMFAVVMKYTGEVNESTNLASTSNLSNQENWHPVSGDPIKGWNVYDTYSMENIIEAAKENPYTFKLESDGSYKVDVENMPGDIMTYYYLLGEGEKGKARYTITYFYTTEDDINKADKDNTYRLVTTTEDTSDTSIYERAFSANVYVPNISNNLFVQKVDQEGNALTGAEFTLYRDDQVSISNDGKLAVNSNVQDSDLKKLTTENLTKEKDDIKLDGGGIFRKLPVGTYYLVETKAPQSTDSSTYVKSDQITEVVVDNTGVYVDAGEANDDVQVLRGVGSLVSSLALYATDDGVDVTLRNIKAALQTTTDYNGEATTWNPTTFKDEDYKHLLYNTAEADLNYKPIDKNEEAVFTVDAGWSKLAVQQCAEKEHQGDIEGKNVNYIDLKNQDISTVFSGTNIVKVTNKKAGALTVSKAVTGLAEEESDNTKFSFTLDLTGQSNNSLTYTTTGTVTVDGGTTNSEGINTVNITEGKVTFTLTKDSQITFDGFTKSTDDIKYTVTEATNNAYQTSYSVNGGSAVDGNSTQQTLKLDDTNTVAFTNEKLHTLSVTKNVEGKYGDMSSPFDIEVTIADFANQKGIAYTIGNTQMEADFDANGKTTIKLSNGQTAVFSGIKAETNASVKETDTKADQYKVSYTKGQNDSYTEGTTFEISATDTDNTITVTNTKDTPPDTLLDINNPGTWALVTGVAVLGLMLLAIVAKQRKRRLR
ncbi:MAG: SpaA isopeptide-forming pilin-related protein [Eubacterium sp.]|nr:SpaA isopeptide-forming pilin-related protein [Eubacterium sp.]